MGSHIWSICSAITKTD